MFLSFLQGAEKITFTLLTASVTVQQQSMWPRGNRIYLRSFFTALGSSKALSWLFNLIPCKPQTQKIKHLEDVMCISSQWRLLKVTVFWMMFLPVLFEVWWCILTEKHQMRPVALWPGVTGLCYLHNESRCDVLRERLNLENGCGSWCTLG